MSQDKVLLIAGDTALGERVSRLLTERGMLVVDDQLHPWTIRRTPFFRTSRSGMKSPPGELSVAT